ncbi:rho GTPase-activating protein 100F-like isoform X2 [Lineus longissimus]|uniref:rho GTPase-activating protein 100F-like isoform X2 n=1 Tax=Lineus longissimus TaxID=88925 RepID=UPI00315DE04B
MLCCGRKKEELDQMSQGRGRAGSLKEPSTERPRDVPGKSSRSDHDLRSKVVSQPPHKVDSETQTLANRAGSRYNNNSEGNCSKSKGRRDTLEMGIKNMEVQDDDSIVQTVEILKRPGQTLGFYIREGNGMDRQEGVFISRIALGSVVENNGLLRVGDEILSVNAVDVGNVSLDDVVILMSIPKRLVLKIRTSRSTSKNASCPSLSTLDQEEPPVVVVKKCRSSSATAIEMTERCPDEFSGRYGSSPSHDPYSGHGSSRGEPPLYKSKLVPGYLKRAEQMGEMSVDVSFEQGKIRDGGHSSPGDRGRSMTSSGQYAEYSPRPKRSQSRYAKDYVELNLRRDYSSDSEVTQSFYERKPQSRAYTVYAPLHYGDPHQQLVVTDDEDPYSIGPDGVRLRHPRQNKLLSPDAYNSDSELVYHKIPQNSSIAAYSDSETGYISSVSAGCVGEDNRSNSLPRMDGGESSDEIRHWLKKFDTLSCDVDDDGHSPRMKHGLPNDTGHHGAPQDDKESYTAEEYSSWVHTKSPSLQRKAAANPGKNHPQVMRQWSADASSTSLQRSESLDQSDFSQEQRHHASMAPPIPSKARHISRSYSTTSSKVKPSPQDQGGDLKNLPHYISRIRDLQLTRKPVQIRIDDFETYRTERRSRRHLDEKVKGYDGLLQCHVLSGHGLKSSSTMLRDLYCIVEVDNLNKARTMIRTGAINFDWDEPFDIELENAKELTFLVYNWDPNARHKLCFYGVVNLQFLFQCGKNHKIGLRLEPKGILYLDLSYKEPAVTLKRTPSLHKTALFGVDLETIIRREKSGLRVPILVKKCIDEVDRRGLETVGIYRLCGSAKRKTQIKEEFEKNSRGADLSPENVSDINVVTGLLKDFLRELPEPLFTNTLYQMLLDSINVRLPGDPSSNKLMMSLLDCLPKVNQDTMIMLMNHLKRVVLKADLNKMTSQNVAVCFGPVLLCPAPSSITDVEAAMDFKKHIEVLKYLLDIWPESRENQRQYQRSQSVDRAGEQERGGSPQHHSSPKHSSKLPDQHATYASKQEVIYADRHHVRQHSEPLYAEVRPRRDRELERARQQHQARQEGHYARQAELQRELSEQQLRLKAELDRHLTERELRMRHEPEGQYSDRDTRTRPDPDGHLSDRESHMRRQVDGRHGEDRRRPESHYSDREHYFSERESRSPGDSRSPRESRELGHDHPRPPYHRSSSQPPRPHSSSGHRKSSEHSKPPS